MRKVIFSISIIILAIWFLNDNYAQIMKSKSERDFEVMKKGITLQKTPAQIIDSLKIELEKVKVDTIKINILNNISDMFININTDSAIKYIEKAITYSNKIKWDIGEARAYQKKGNILESLKNMKLAVEIYILSQKIYERIGDLNNLYMILERIGNIYRDMGDFPKVLDYYKEVLKIAKTLRNERLIAQYLNNIGNVYLNTSEYTLALEYFQSALELNEENGEKNNIPYLLGNIGNVFVMLSDFSKSIEYFEKSQMKAEEIGDIGSVTNALINKGNVYENLSEFNKASKNYLKALKIMEESGKSRGIAFICGILGNVNNNLLDYDNAILYSERSMQINDSLRDKNGISFNFRTLGDSYFGLKQYEKAIEYYEKSFQIYDQIGVKPGAAEILSKMGKCYLQISKFEKSLEFFEKSLIIYEKLDIKREIYANQINIANLFFKISKNSTDSLNKIEYFSKGVENYKKGLEGFHNIKELKSESDYLNELSENYIYFGDYKSALEKFKEAQILQDSIFSSENLKKIAELEAKKDLEIKEKENEVLKNQALLKESELNRRNQELANLNNQQKIQKLELDKKNLDLLSRNNELNLLNKEKELKDLALKQKDIENQKNSNEIKLLNNEKKYQGVVRNSLIIGLTFIFVILILLFLFFWKKKKDNKLLTEKNNQIENANIELTSLNTQVTEQNIELSELNENLALKNIEISEEREKSEKLLLNVLPLSIAERLKSGEKQIADHFEEASVIFIDIVDFTKMSAKSSPQKMVSMLNDIFSIFDKISAKYGLEKIKTIGDCYMAAAGIPVPRKDHAYAIAMMALEVKETMKGYSYSSDDFMLSDESNIINFRIGLDCGPIVAGVIGEQKFIYDLWGDMVNTASRMETNGVVGKIQCTGRFKEKVEEIPLNPPFSKGESAAGGFNPFPNVESSELTFREKGRQGGFFFIERGEIEIKGKGMMKTYFLEMIND